MTGSSYSLDNEVKPPQKQHFFLRLDFVDYNSFSLFLDGQIHSTNTPIPTNIDMHKDNHLGML